jgi:hypothetical protein
MGTLFTENAFWLNRAAYEQKCLTCFKLLRVPNLKEEGYPFIYILSFLDALVEVQKPVIDDSPVALATCCMANHASVWSWGKEIFLREMNAEKGRAASY